MSVLASAIKSSASRAGRMTRTENGMLSYTTSGNALLDLFGKIGSARGYDTRAMFDAAVAENEEVALRILLWARDVRGGAGERKTFRNNLAHLDASMPEISAQLMHMVPVVGRWDDLLYAYPVGSKNRKAAIEMIGAALKAGDGLCAKWMPRQGPVAVELRNVLDYSPKAWRKTLVALTNVVEQKMCAKDWDSINFSHVPSLAAARYQAAFKRNAGDAYGKYLAELAKPVEQRDPKVKINAGAVYPYDVIKSLNKGSAAAADAQWDALENFVGDNSILPIVDVSGSMTQTIGGNSSLTAMDVSVSLGMYCASKNTGPFKDVFMTFSSNPAFVTLTGSLSERVHKLRRADWGMSTDLHKAMDLLLTTALRSGASHEDMPNYLLILSDMQFNSCARYDDTALQMMRRKFNDAGYEMPTIVFWNLAGRTTDTPVQMHNQNVSLVSGFSPAIMKTVLAAKTVTPVDIMMDTVMVPRYDYKNAKAA